MLKILIAEDDRELRTLFSRVLIKYGYTVKGVANGKEALDAMDMEYYDLIISDIMMPVMDGYQALMGIRNLEKERDVLEKDRVKIIMTTALNDEQNVKMAFDLGCTVYSGKPIDKDRFEQAMKKLGLI